MLIWLVLYDMCSKTVFKSTWKLSIVGYTCLPSFEEIKTITEASIEII